MLRPLARLGLLVVAAALAGGCGDDAAAGESLISGDTVTIYSSVPLRGELEPVARDVVAAQKLALQEAGGRAGIFSVAFATLDSTDPETGRWDPERVAANAREAVQNPQTIAYLGEFETGASAISVPILNEGGMLQVSPRDTFGGLTAPGARGEPEKYYPSGLRTFTRMVPGDDVQAAELVDALGDRDVRRLSLADDRRLAGASLGDRVARLARAAGIRVVDRERLDPRDDVPDDLGRDVRRERADAFLYTGRAGEFATAALRRVHADAPAADLLAGDDLTLLPGVARRVGDAAERLLVTGIEPRPREGDAAFERRFEAAFGREPARDAVLGYDAMRLVLGAIARAGADAVSRRAVIREALAALAEPRARFARYRVDGNRLVTVGPRL